MKKQGLYRFLLILALGIFLSGMSVAEEPKPVLFAYVGAGIKDPVIELGEIFEFKTGIRIEMTFNNSGSLLAQLKFSKKGDLYIPGSMPFVQKAKAAGYISEVVGPMAYHVPIIITPKNNPAKIVYLNDLAKPGVKLILPDKKGTALGQTAFKIFKKLGITDEIEENILAYMETPYKVISAIQLGQGDAGIVEYSNAKNHKDLGFIEIDPAVNEAEELPCASLNCSTHEEATYEFLKFAQTEGPIVFAKYGFKTRL